MSKNSILIVEDEAIVAADLASKLQQLGYEIVGTASTAEDAIRLVDGLHPSLVLMDIQLEGQSDGIEAAQAISSRNDLPIIYLTAHSDAATLSRAKLSGPFGYILKPFEERELATTIEMALFKHDSDRRLREQRDQLEIRSAELTSANEALRASRTAALNLMDDAISAREQAEKATRKLQLEVDHRKRVEEALRESEERVSRKLDSIISPEGDIADLDLSDIIDTSSVQALMDDFYKLAHMPMSIIDLKGKMIVGVGWQKICTEFHRVNPETRRNCVESDMELTRGVPEGEFKLYRCKNKMWDIATPIIVGGKHMGNLLMGQFFFDDEPLEYEVFRSQARLYGFDEEKYIEALEAVPRLSRDVLQTSMSFFRRLSDMVSKSSYSTLKLARALSERETLADSLRKSEGRLARAQEIAHLGSWELDLMKNALTWSDEVYRIFGLEPREFTATYEAFLEHVHPDDRAAVDSAYSESVRNGSDSYEIEHRILQNDTNEIRWVHEKCQHIRDEAGRIIRSVGMVHDITDRKKAEEVTGRLAAIVENSEDAIIGKDLNGIVISWNVGAERIFGYTAEEAIGRNISFLAPSESDYETLRIIERIRRGEHVARFETTRLRKDGTVIPVSLTFSPIRDPQGKIIGVSKTAHDITERKKAEAELLRLNKAFKALSDSSQAIVRARNEAEYLNLICRVVVEDCGYRMVWVGYAEDDETKSVRPVAFSGFEDGYLETLRLTWADTERGQGPTGTAIRTGRVAVCRNMLTDPAFEPWREHAIRKGYASSIVFPLKTKNKVFGAITIYSCEPDPFTESEVSLLTELADNLSYGIEVLRMRAAREKAEEALELSLGRFELLAYTADGLLKMQEPQKVVNELCRKVMDYLDCQTFFNFIVDEREGCLHLNAYAGIPEEEASRIEWLDFGVAVCGCVARDGRRLIAEHIPTTPDERTDLVRSYGVKAYACHPLLGPGGKTIGTLSFGSSVRETFSEDDLAMMKAVADQVAVAIIRLRGEQTLRDREQRLRGHNAILEGINLIFQKSITIKLEEELLQAYLAIIEEITRSKISFIAEIGPDGLLHDLAISNPGWDLCAMYDKAGHRSPQRDFGIQGVFGRVLVDGKGLFTNDPGSHPDSVGIPKGHPPLKSFLGVPLMHAGKTIGMIGVGNRPDGYSQSDLIALEALAPAIVESLYRVRAEEELRRLTAELKRSNDDLQQFARFASHDLQAPLKTAEGFIKLLVRRYKGKLDKQGDELLGYIVESTKDMQSLIRDLLEFSRIETSGNHVRPVDTGMSLAHALANLKAEIDERKAEVIYDDSMPTVMGDRTQMLRLFQNLIGNSLKFSKEVPPRVIISVLRRDSEWVFSVRDNGIGIDPRYHGRIFDIFQRLHGKSEFPGTGMGLAMCKRIVERIGGKIWVESEIGKGSTFFFSLPVGKGQGSSSATA